MPWRRADPLSAMGTITLETYIVQIPDLIGVRDRRYLDGTGLIEQRDIGDLMRYAALNQAAELMTRFGDFVPVGDDLHDLPPAQKSRFSDEQWFALANYIR